MSGAAGVVEVGARAGRAARAGCALLAAAAAALAPLAVAHADDGSVLAVKTAWYWSLTGASVQGQALPADPPTEASLVPDGSLGVAYLADQEDATPLATNGADRVSAVQLDLGAVPAGSTFSSLVVSIPLDPNAHQVMPQTPDLSACELLDSFSDSPAPQPITQVPPYSPGSCVKGTFVPTMGAAGGFRFDLTVMANDWSGGAPNEGVLIRPTAGLATPQAPFSISLVGKNGITGQASSVPPAAPETAPPPPAAPPVVPALAPAPAMPGTLEPPTTPVLPAPALPAPQVNPQPATPLLAQVAYRPGDLVPGGRWWLGLLGLLALLGATALVLGDPLVPVPADPRQRRFAEVVRTSSPAARLPVSRVRTGIRPA